MTPLPPHLAARLRAAADSLRRRRITRIVATAVALLVSLALLATLADFALGESLPSFIRSLLLLGWSAFAVVLGVRVYRAYAAPPDLAAVAALVERRYPHLGERLTTAVDLSGEPSPGTGSPAMIALLLRETASRTESLEFAEALPRPTGPRLRVGLAAVVVALAVTPFAAAPQTAARLAQRFFLPPLPSVRPDFAFEVTPGSAFAATGRQAVVTVRLTPTHDKADEGSPALVVESKGREALVPLVAKPDGTREASILVEGDVTYFARAGNARSRVHTLTAVTPTELADGSPVTTVVAPDYAKKAYPDTAVVGLVDATCVRGGSFALSFAFNQPAASASLEWTPAGGKMSAVEVNLSPDSTSASVVLPASSTGSWRLTLGAAHGITTVIQGPTLTVKPDLPPAVVRFGHVGADRLLRPTDRLVIDGTFADDIGVSSVELLTSLNGGPENRETVAMTGEDSRDVTVRRPYPLAGKVKVGDTLKYRLRVSDNRPAALGGPNVVYHPEKGSLVVRIISQGSSPRDDEIVARRDAAESKLDEAKAALAREAEQLAELEEFAKQRDELTPKDRDKAEAARAALERRRNELAKAGRESDIEDVGKALEETASREVARAEQAVRESAEATAEKAREKLAQARAELDKAADRLDEAKRENRARAEREREAGRIEELADRQRALSEKADAADDRMRTAREQEELSRSLDELTGRSEALAESLEKARAQAAREAASRAEELAAAERRLAKAADELEKRRRMELFGDLAKRQRALNERAAALEKDPESPRGKAGEEAADALAHGDAEKAMASQEKAARELDRLGGDGAKQLAVEQRALRDELRKQESAAKEEQRAEAASPAGPLDSAAKEQRDIAKAAETLAEELKAEKAQSAKRETEKAAKALEEGTPAEAKGPARAAADDLAKLAGDLAKSKDAGGEALQKARELAKRQEALAKSLAEGKADRAGMRARQSARQDELAKEAGEVRKEMERVGRETKSEERRAAAKEAVGAAMRAEEAMQAGRREEAARAMAQAADAAKRAGEGGEPGEGAGRSLRQAGDDMRQARRVMEEGGPGGRAAMRRAADRLDDAAKMLARGTKTRGGDGMKSDDFGATPGGTPDGKTLPAELLPHIGKRWGELPGEVRSKVVQQMAARYGDEYARAIKLYFERLADTRRK